MLMLGIKLTLSGIFSFYRVPYNSLLMDTFLFPPKTSIIGMMGAAIGWNEDVFLENLKKFRYGVIIEKAGESFSEIAVIYKSKNSPIYPITKNLVHKPVYNVFLTSEDDSLTENIGKALQNPKYVLTLGDSENLFYPLNKNYIRILKIKENMSATKLRCILPSEIYNEYVVQMNVGEMFPNKNLLLPREIRIPIDFVEQGKNRRFIPKNVFYYAGIELQLKNPVKEGVYDFDGDPVYLF